MTSAVSTSPVLPPVRRRELWWQLTVRAVETRHRGSYLGVVWAVLSPLMMLALYYVVFTYFLPSTFAGEGRPMFALGVFLGLILFHLVSETISTAPLLIVNQPNLVKKVVFPLELLPVAQLGACWFHFAISALLLLVGIQFLGQGLTLGGVLWMPAILAPVALLTAGLAWFISALGVFLRDIGQVVPFLTQILLWSSAVFYTPEAVAKTPLAWDFLKWNPLLHSVDLARDALLFHLPINLKTLGYTWVVGLAAFAAGRWFFRRMQSSFADVI